MSYYNVCPRCGSHLDPGELCDCKEETECRSESADSIAVRNGYRPEKITLVDRMPVPVSA